MDAAGPVITVSVDFPVEGRQRGRSLTLKVPARLELRIEKNSDTDVDQRGRRDGDRAGRHDYHGKSPGRYSATQRGSAITLTDVGSLKLTTLSGAEAKLSEVQGDVTLRFRAGELHAEALAGSHRNRIAQLRHQAREAREGSADRRINAVNGEIVRS